MWIPNLILDRRSTTIEVKSMSCHRFDHLTPESGRHAVWDLLIQLLPKLDFDAR